MATKAQAKAAIDAVVGLIKADIDLSPTGVNIIRGTITINPDGWTIEYLVPTLADGITLRNALATALTNASRPHTTSYRLKPLTSSTAWPPSDGTVIDITIISNNSRFKITFS